MKPTTPSPTTTPTTTTTTRRQLLAGIAGILATSTAPAYITKYLLAAASTNFIEETQPYTGSYVTDGLIAFWDAEWNAGLNMHDPSSRILVNLCGGSPIYLSEAVSVHRKHLSFTTSSENECGGVSDPMNELPQPGTPHLNLLHSE